eukprot:TRINITY_DN15892_c0_g1_i1.p1 TRINITY_DN15892_c0_g1~~TRINITY_DN15892_c0_g1_i1.p1  ORF type:complete len:142 (+),score=23.72 TRINITY_DN15892_c0_g1_i1:71-496(+)
MCIRDSPKTPKPQMDYILRSSEGYNLMEEEKFVKSCILERLTGHMAAVTALASAPAFDNEGSFYSKTFITEGVLASGSEDGTIRVWDSRVNKYGREVTVGVWCESLKSAFAPGLSALSASTSLASNSFPPAQTLYLFFQCL